VGLRLVAGGPPDEGLMPVTDCSQTGNSERELYLGRFTALHGQKEKRALL